MDEQTPCALSASDGQMEDYFNLPEKQKKYSGRRRCTLPVKIDEDLKKAAAENVLTVSKFEKSEDLQKLKSIAGDRELHGGRSLT